MMRPALRKVFICSSVDGLRQLCIAPPPVGYRAATVCAQVLDFRILGPLEVVADGTPLGLGGPKQRATLAILLLAAGRVVSIDRLADDLYRGAPPATAVTQVQRHVSELRKVLGNQSAIETRPPGYLIPVPPDHLDLARFEAWTSKAADDLRHGDALAAVELLRSALGLWRGAPLADLTHEPFAQPAIGRLEEIRLTAIEQRIEAELVLGRHRELVGELRALNTEHPLREGLSSQLMRALYRSGRQAESLDAFRRTRELLVEQFGIEPTPELRALERAILTQDASLDRPGAVGEGAGAGRLRGPVLVVAPREPEHRVDALLTVAEALAKLPPRELIVACLVADQDEVHRAATVVDGRRASIETATRGAVFTTTDTPADIARLVEAHDIDLVLTEFPGEIAGRLPADLITLLSGSTADVVLLAGPAPHLGEGDGIFVPFGGGAHDWAALEVAAWLASATGSPLRLVGTRADPRRGRRDASRLLADASLAVQRVLRVETHPVLAAASEEGLLAAVETAAIVVAGIPENWRRAGLGASRRALVSGAGPATLLVHRGLRPGGVAPRDTRTRFTWTLEGF